MENRRIERNNRKVDKKRRTITLIKTFILDIVITGLCLVIFALFHHVIPASKATVGRQLPAPTQQITQAVTETGTETTASADPSPSQGPSDNSTAVLNNGFFPEKYTDGEPVRTDNSFVGRNVSVTLSKVEYKPGTYYYFADIYLRDVKYLRTVFATGEFVQGKAGWVKDMTEGKNAVIAINGDYCGGHPQGQVVRDGLLYRDRYGKMSASFIMTVSWKLIRAGNSILIRLLREAYGRCGHSVRCFWITVRLWKNSTVPSILPIRGPRSDISNPVITAL